MKYIVDIKGEIEGDYEIIGKYEERPQGEWIYHKSDGYFLPYMECSNCKVQDLLENLTKKEYREVNHFCFNCGADMRKGGAECMEEDAKQASIPYTYSSPQHDWKCGYPDSTGGK